MNIEANFSDFRLSLSRTHTHTHTQSHTHTHTHTHTVDNLPVNEKMDVSSAIDTVLGNPLGEVYVQVM